jgi:hypothetical protein
MMPARILELMRAADAIVIPADDRASPRAPALPRPDVAPKASDRSRMVLRELIALHRHGNKR